MFYRCKPVRKLELEVKTASKIACRKLGKYMVFISECLKQDNKFFDILLETLRKMDNRFSYHIEIYKSRSGEMVKVAWEDIPNHDPLWLTPFVVRENPHVNYSERAVCFNVYRDRM